jgi:hypothetical protein
MTKQGGDSTTALLALSQTCFYNLVPVLSPLGMAFQFTNFKNILADALILTHMGACLINVPGAWL